MRRNEFPSVHVQLTFTKSEYEELLSRANMLNLPTATLAKIWVMRGLSSGRLLEEIDGGDR